jgi:phytoene dehydrogenase-like protein
MFAAHSRTGPCAHIPVPISQRVVEDLRLEELGWSLKPEQTCSFVPFGTSPNEYIFATSGRQATQREIAKISRTDAEKFVSLFDQLCTLGAVFDEISDNYPTYNQKGWQDLWSVFETGKLLAKAGPEIQDLFTRLMRQSLTQFLKETFDTDAVRGYLGFQAMLGGMSNPDRPGSAAAILQYILGLDRHRPLKGDWQPVRGNIHSFMKALTQSALQQGVEFTPGVFVEEVRALEGKILSLNLANDTIVTADHYIGDVNPIMLFSHMMAQEVLPPDFRLKIENMAGSNGFVRIKMLLNGLPQFSGLSGFGDESFLSGEILISPSMEYIKTALSEARAVGGAQLPSVSMSIPTLIAPEFAPEGKHVVSILAQFFDPSLEDTEENRNNIATSVARAIETVAPGFSNQVEEIAVFMGDKLDGIMGPLSRDSFQGNLPLNQIFATHFGYHSLGAALPFDNLFMCGYGPEASACAHTNNGGVNVAENIRQIRDGAGAKAGRA